MSGCCAGNLDAYQLGLFFSKGDYSIVDFKSEGITKGGGNEQFHRLTRPKAHLIQPLSRIVLIEFEYFYGLVKGNAVGGSRHSFAFI